MIARRRTVRAVAWYLAAIAVISALGVADDLIRRSVLLALALAGTAAGYVLGRHHGRRRGPGPKAVTRRLEDAQRARLVAELEHLAARSLDEITESYRVIARRHGGGAS